MKNKGLTYSLLFVALMVWGGIFYRFFAAINEGSDTNLPNRFQSKKTAVIETVQDTFVLLANYKDPFLGRIVPTATNYDNNSISNDRRPSTTRKVKPQKPIPVPVVQVQWPPMKYMGVIQNKNTDKLVGILQVNGQEQMVKPNDLAAGIRIVAIHKDTIALFYQNDKKTLYKGQSYP